MLPPTFYKLKYLFFIFVCISPIFDCTAQDRHSFFNSDSCLNTKKITLVACTESVLYTGSLIGLSELWYKDYPRSSFHTFNDNHEWLQMDKIGHLVTSYSVGNIGINLLKWSGVKHKKAIWYGGLLGFLYLGSIELLDGFSEEWGFSWGDLSANTLGSTLLIGQELLWKEQRVILKFSAMPTNYAKYRPEVLGHNFSEQLLKDYNGQTYWLSLNIASFMPKATKFPKWLNLAFGYGATGMTGGNSNPVIIDNNGNPLLFDRYRQYYLSVDIDLTRIKTKSMFLKVLFKTINFIKIPAPTLLLDKKGVNGSFFYF